jgi:hypothetical protein
MGVKRVQHSKYSNKGFAFVLEVTIALIIFAAFMQLSLYQVQNAESPIQKTELKQLTNSIISFLDYNGFMLDSLDSSSLSNQEKIDSIYSTLSNYIPNAYKYRIELAAYDGNREKCVATEDFENCFTKRNPFPVAGEEIPTDKSYSFERYYFLSKGSPQYCDIGAIFSPSQKTMFEKLFFAEQEEIKPKLFFAESLDLNIFFGLEVSPTGEVSCGETIRADLNAHIIVPGRAPADIMLVQDKSGSMSWDGRYDFSYSRDVFADGNYAYVAEGSNGLRILDVSAPSSPSLESTFNTSGYAQGVHVDGDYAYVADDDDGLDIINISNKSSPSLTGNITNIGDAEKVFVQDDYAYVVTSTNGSGSLSFEIDDSQNTQTYVGRSNNEWAAQSFVATQESLSRIDVRMKRTSSVPQRDLTVAIRSSLQGSNLASDSISRYSIGTSYAWETAEFSSPVSLTIGQTYYVVLTTSRTHSSRYYSWASNNNNPYSQGTAYRETTQLTSTDSFMRLYSSIPSGLQIIDISNKSNPQHVQGVDGSDPMDVFVEGDYAYLADGSYGLKVIDIADKENASVVGSVDTSDATGIYYYDNFVYIADRSSGVRSIDVSNKTSPFIEDTYNTSGDSWDVFVYDNNLYVADEIYFQILDISDPTNIGFLGSYSTPYDYEKLHIINDWAFLTPGYSSSLITFNIYSGPKMDQSIRAGKDFVEQAQWQDGDSIGLVSFSSSDTTDQTLLRVDDTNRQILKDKLDALVSGGGTAIGDAIYAATTELTSSRVGENDYKFQILLSDGQSNSGSSPITAANDAASEGIKIYTIGFGGDADTSTLESIASITDGNYYFASDENALQNVYDLIAIDIGDILAGAGAGKVYDSNIMIPLASCDYVTDTGDGNCIKIGDQNYLYYDIGYLDRYVDWNSYFELIIPCDVSDACSMTTLTVPFDGTFFFWKDENGLQKPPIQWDTNIELNFKYRDLTLEIISAALIGPNQLSIDVNAQNIGLLSSPQTTLDFYLDDPVTGTFLKQTAVSSLSSGENIIYFDERVDEDGLIYIIINKDKSILECPGNNISSVNCFDAPRTRYYVMDLWVWKNES